MGKCEQLATFTIWELHGSWDCCDLKKGGHSSNFAQTLRTGERAVVVGKGVERAKVQDETSTSTAGQIVRSDLDKFLASRAPEDSRARRCFSQVCCRAPCFFVDDIDVIHHEPT